MQWVLTLKIVSPHKKHMVFGTLGSRPRSWRMYGVPNYIHSQHVMALQPELKQWPCLWLRMSVGQWESRRQVNRYCFLWFVAGLTAYSNSHLLTRKWRVDGISDHIAVYVQPANSQTVLNFYFVLLSKDF